MVVLKNERTEIRLGALCLKDVKAETITDGIMKLLDEYNLWHSTKMIVADTTSVNTGKKLGVVVKLQQNLQTKVSANHSSVHQLPTSHLRQNSPFGNG